MERQAGGRPDVTRWHGGAAWRTTARRHRAVKKEVEDLSVSTHVEIPSVCIVMDADGRVIATQDPQTRVRTPVGKDIDA